MKLSSDLLRRAARAAADHARLSGQVTDAFRDRYGVTHSDVDCDELIDALDYGTGPTPTLARCDELMKEAGAPKL